MFVVFSSTAIYECERAAQPGVFSKYTDAVWWSITTLTTVGYGDKFPVTESGRFIATLTVIFGLGVFGTFISLVGSAFISTLNEEKQADQTIQIPAVTHQRLVELQEARGLPATPEAVGQLASSLLDRAVEAEVRRSSTPVTDVTGARG
jgi:hypothetical protein